MRPRSDCAPVPGRGHGWDSTNRDLDPDNIRQQSVARRRMQVAHPAGSELAEQHPAAVHGLVLNWDDAANAASYDVYLDDMVTPKANVTVSQWTVSPSILSVDAITASG